MTIINDYSAIEAMDAHFADARRSEIEERLAPLRTAEKNALANLRFKSGIALLAAGLGIGAAAFGISFIVKPKIIDRPVVSERLVYVDKPIVTERIVQVPAAPTPVSAPSQPPIAKPQTDQQFTQQQVYNESEYHGIIKEYNEKGDVTFSTGKKFNRTSGDVVQNRQRLIGRPAYCYEINPANHHYNCKVLLGNGKEIFF